MSVCKPWLWPYAPSRRRPLDHIWARPSWSCSGGWILQGCRGGRGHRRPPPSMIPVIHHPPSRDILGINWSFMCVTYIIKGACVWMRLESVGAEGGCWVSWWCVAPVRAWMLNDGSRECSDFWENMNQTLEHQTSTFVVRASAVQTRMRESLMATTLA